jgi:hypothetical protein
MTQSQDVEIIALKKKLLHLEESFGHYAKLNHLRQELEEKIEKLQIETKIPFPPTENQKELLHFLKRKKQEVDHLLDDFDDYSDRSIEEMKEELWEQLLSLLSSENPAHAWVSEIKNQRLLEERFSQTLFYFHQISTLLEEAIRTRHQIRGFGLLKYIFGTSPNVVISHFLQECHRSLQSLSTLITSYKAHPCPSYINEHLEEIEQFLIRLNKQCQSQWGFHHIDTYFSKAKEQLLFYGKEIEQDLESAKAKRAILEEQLRGILQLFRQEIQD